MSALADLAKRDALRRIWSADGSLWHGDPAHHATIASRLGWLRSPELMREQVGPMAAFAAEVRDEGFRHVVLVGMGGSSLAPELFARTFPPRGGAPDLRVLDNTSPAAVHRIEREVDLARTLFLVSTKSGTTIETLSFMDHFLGRVGDGRAFAAISDPGTPLQHAAAQKGFRRVFANAADIGGRFSALSYFGLVPAALTGVDVAALLSTAIDEVRRSAPALPVAEVPGMALGAALAEHANAGRDKLTLVLSPEIAALGAWLEQLVAESTGKEGRGILPVDGETLAPPDRYGPDRVFLAVEASADRERDAALAALESAGHPVLRIPIENLHDLGRLFFRFELATAAAGAVLHVDPFDEPNVSEAKETTGALLAEHARTGALPRLPSGTMADVAAFLANVRPGDYVALLAYADGTARRGALLAGVQSAIRDRTRSATTAGFGPRYLHSTGQLHKGGPGRGHFLVLLSGDGRDADIPVPGKPFTFGTLRDAQAIGDATVLARRGRPVLALETGSDPDAFLEELALRSRTAG